jgi:hypothetical protein
VRQFLLIAFVGLVVVSCGGKDSPGSPTGNNALSGTWAGTVTGQLVGSGRVTLAQNGAALTGSYGVTYPDSRLNISGTASGTASGSSLSLTLQPSVPTQCPIAVTATVNGSRMTGTTATFNCTQASSGSIDFTKQ